jgi:acyl CoA:acetate/3-ketoacid CoA transferase alpha subunit
MKSKIMNLTDAVREIPDGAEIAFGGFAITRSPIAFFNELIRQGKKDLIVYQDVVCMGTDMLVGSGAIKRLSYGGGSLDRFGRVERINDAYEKGTIDAREFSGLSIAYRFLAGSLGIPFIPTKILLGTDMIENLQKKNDDSLMITLSPFDEDEKLVLLKSLQPDYAVIHAPYADEKGNVMIDGPVWDLEMGKAAKKLYVTVDQIVSNEFVKMHPEKVTIPNIYVHGIIEVPYGAYPTAVYKMYDYDGDMLTKYAKCNKKQEDFDEFMKEYVLGTKDHDEFLEKCGGVKMLSKIKADPVYGYSKNWGDADEHQ